MEHECSIYSSIWWKAVRAEGRENGAGGQESLGRNPVWYLSRPSESLSGAQGLHRSIRKVGQQSYSLGLLHPFTGDQGAVSCYLVITEATPFFISSPDLYSCIAGWWDQALHQIIALFSFSLSNGGIIIFEVCFLCRLHWTSRWYSILFLFLIASLSHILILILLHSCYYA